MCVLVHVALLRLDVVTTALRENQTRYEPQVGTGDVLFLLYFFKLVLYGK